MGPKFLRTIANRIFILCQVVLLNLEALAELSASPAGPPRNSSEEPTGMSALNSHTHELTMPHRNLNKYFHKFMDSLVKLFRNDRKLLEERGSFILR